MTDQTQVENIFSTISGNGISTRTFYPPILQDNKGKTVFDYLLQPIRNETLATTHKMDKNK